jgi:hypothetical protein
MNPENKKITATDSNEATLNAGSLDNNSSFNNEPCDRYQQHVTDICEQDLVRWILGNSLCRQMFIPKVAQRYGQYRESIPHSKFYNSMSPKGGDIDFIILDGDNFTHAVCVEFKRIKFHVRPNGKCDINKIEELKRLIAQGNARYRQGFWKSFICPIAVIDSHEHKTSNVLVKDHESAGTRIIQKLCEMVGLQDSVGIIIVEITQPTVQSIDLMGGCAIVKVKDAIEQTQSVKLTDDLMTVFP